MAYTSDEEGVPMELDLTAGGPPDHSDTSGSGGHSSGAPLVRTLNRYARMVLPHVGLVLLLAFYTLAGAVVFVILELPNEKIVRARELHKVSAIRERLIATLWFVHNSTEAPVSEQHFRRITTDSFDELAIAMYSSFKNQFITDKDLRNMSRDSISWTFANSIFFSTTVITTIGYGHMTPATVYGRMFCIIFGLFGIPLLLVTIADIGKFLSDFLNFVYRMYRTFIRKIRRTSRRMSVRVRRSLSKSPSPDKMHLELGRADAGSEDSDRDEIRLPVVMVLIVLLVYTATGGALFHYLEQWDFLDAFYFCFITMATVGFGDIVPSQQMYMLITMAYIIMGLALTTMCIDLCGTEYIRKIHYVGTKMESAKGVMVRGLHSGEHLLKSTGYGFIRTAGGKLIAVRRAADDGQTDTDDFFFEDEINRNILYEPLSPAVLKHVHKAGIEVLPTSLTESDVGFMVRNRAYNRRPAPLRRQLRSPNAISRVLVRRHTRVWDCPQLAPAAAGHRARQGQGRPAPGAPGGALLVEAD